MDDILLTNARIAEANHGPRPPREAPPVRRSSRRFALYGPIWCLAAATVLLAGGGCAMHHDNHYSAAELPAQYAAAPSANPQLIDFTRLSGSLLDSDVIGPGDVLDVNIIASVNTRDSLPSPVTVGSDGNASIPLVGQVHLAGLGLIDAEAVIARASMERRVYRTPHVIVTMRKRKTIRVLVTGAVRSPGMKEIPVAESDLLSVIFHSGGLSEDAGVNVEISNVLTREEALHDAIAAAGPPGLKPAGYSARPLTPKSMQIDLISAAREGGNSYFIGDRGVVTVEKLEPKAVHVLGLVRKPGRIDFPVRHDLHLLDAIALSGYTSSQVADKVYVIRNVADSATPVVIQASLLKARHDPLHNPRLAAGDVVTVEHTPATIILEVLHMVRIGVSGSLNPLLF